MEEYVYITNSNQSLSNSITISNLTNKNVTYVKGCNPNSMESFPVTYVSENCVDLQAKAQSKVSFYSHIWHDKYTLIETDYDIHPEDFLTIH